MIYNIRHSTVICLIIVSIYVVLAQGINDSIVPITYVSYVDDYYGFYKVRDITTNKPSLYEGRTLTINQGDIVKWKNEGTASMILVSDQNLWTKENGKLNKDISYKFDSPGKYTFYIQSDGNMRQTVMVNPVSGYESGTKVTATVTAVQAPIPTDASVTPGRPSINDTLINDIISPNMNNDTVGKSNIRNDNRNGRNDDSNIRNDNRNGRNDDSNINGVVQIHRTGIVSILVSIISLYVTYKIGRRG